MPFGRVEMEKMSVKYLPAREMLQDNLPFVSSSGKENNVRDMIMLVSYEITCYPSVAESERIIQTAMIVTYIE